MAKRKKPLINRLASLILFLFITFVVFNFGNIVQQSMIVLGFADLNWVEINKININSDEVLDNRAQVFSFNDSIIISSNNEISIYNRDGKLVVKREIVSASSKVIGMDDYFVVVDNFQGHIIVMDYFGKIVAPIEFLGPIKETVYISNNIFVVITVSNQLHVYNHEGALISDFDLPKGELLSLDVSEDKETLLLTLLTSNESGYKSKLLTYSMLSNAMIGGHQAKDTIVFGTKLYQNDILIVDMLGQYANEKGDSENTLWQNERLGTLMNFEIDNNGNIYELIEVEESKELTGKTEYHLTCINKDGKKIFDKVLDNRYQNIKLNKGEVLLLSDQDIMILNSDGTLVSQYDSNKKIYDAEWLLENRILIEYNDFVEILELSY